MLKIIIIQAQGEEVTGALELFRGALNESPSPTPTSPMAQPTQIPTTPAKRGSLTGPAKPGKPASRIVDAQTSMRMIEWTKYPLRSAGRDLGLCAICQARIEKSDSYYDGGFDGRRAHSTCGLATRTQEANGAA